jgi:hypothetical protein
LASAGFAPFKAGERKHKKVEVAKRRVWKVFIERFWDYRGKERQRWIIITFK